MDVLEQGCTNHSNKYGVEVSLWFENLVYHVNGSTSPYPRETFLTILLYLLNCYSAAEHFPPGVHFAYDLVQMLIRNFELNP